MAEGDLISAERLTKEVIAMQFQNQPAVGADVHSEIFREAENTLAVLNQAVSIQSPELFEDYLRWYQVLQQSREMESSTQGDFLAALQSILSQDRAAAVYQQLAPFLIRGEGALEGPEEGHRSFLNGSLPYNAEAKAYMETVISGKRRETFMLLNQFLQSSIPIQDIYLYIFQPVQREVGRLWQLNRLSISQEHYASNLTRTAMAQLTPLIIAGPRNGFSLLAASVGRELHDLGLRMVADFFEMEGWDCYYLGANTPVEAIVQAVQENHPHILALSATISTQLNQVAEIIRHVRLAESGNLKILVGGYPFNVAPTAWQQVGADGYAMDAKSAVQMGMQLLSL